MPKVNIGEKKREAGSVYRETCESKHAVARFLVRMPSCYVSSEKMTV